VTRKPAEIRDEIEATREELADTAAALAYKTDVKARGKEKAAEVKARAVEAPRRNPVPTAAIVAAVVLAAFLIARRRGG
jgi:hypothetical protein